MITFNVTEQQADQILNALGQRPYIESVGLIGVLMQQAQQQQQKAQEQEQVQHSNPNGNAQVLQVNGLDHRV